MSTTKGVQVTVGKELAERMIYLRKFKHRLPDLNKQLEQALLEVAESAEKRLKIDKNDWRDARACPKCSSGVLVKRQRRGDANAKPFMGCNRYPDCRHSEDYVATKRSRKK